jgi:DNA polymerase I-like protein with 3'-5' exonuclease and polymerase domains
MSERLITLDFETHYSKEYSLSRMTTEAYVRDPRFETIGVGARVDDGPLEWMSGSDLDIGRYLRFLDLPKARLLCHNTAFDAAILSWRYGINPKFMFDTMSMARPVTGHTVGVSLAALSKKFALGEKGNEVVAALGKRRSDFTPQELAQYGEYCKNDVLLTYNLFHVLQQFSTPQEMYIIDMMLRMFTDPVIRLDERVLTRHLTDVQERKEKLLERIDASIGLEQLMSNDKFAEVLTKLGVAPPTKISAATGKETYAFAKTDVEFKALLEHEDERVQAVTAARFGVKSTLEETRTQSFIQIAKRGLLPILLNYYGGHTGRASGGDKVNLQNLPRGGALRYSMRAPEGHVMVACDSAQIEARVLAWFAGEVDLVADFAAGVDVYSKFATGIYGYEVDKTQKVERFVGKTGILSLGFGVGEHRFKAALKTATPSVDMPLEQAKGVVDLYRGTYVKIVKVWDDATLAIKAMARGQQAMLGTVLPLLCDHEGVHLPNGMKLRYPNLRYLKADNDKIKKDGYYYDGRYGVVSMYGAKLIENVIQALARIVVFNQMAKVDQSLKKHDLIQPNLRFRVALTVHDEVVAIVPEAVEEKVKAMMLKYMAVAPKWAPGLPLACEAESGYSYGEAK